MEDLAVINLVLYAIAIKHSVALNGGKSLEVDGAEAVAPFILLLERLPLEEAAAFEGEVLEEDRVYFARNQDGKRVFVLYEGAKLVLDLLSVVLSGDHVLACVLDVVLLYCVQYLIDAQECFFLRRVVGLGFFLFAIRQIAILVRRDITSINRTDLL